MKKSKRILSILLTTLIVLQVFATALIAQAATTTKSPYDNKTYTHYLNLDSSKILNGIDVSYHNGSINWSKVKADGVKFVFLRIGYRGYGTTGSLNKDTAFDTYYSGAKAAGIKIGIYFYSQALNESEANAEANFALQLLNGRSLDLPIVFDYEFAGVSTGRLDKANLSKRQMTNNVHAFCETVEGAGYSSMLYANKSFLNDHLYADEVAAHYPIWIARYDATKLDFTKGVSAWQYTSSGTVDGISGRTDANFLYDGLTLTRIRGIEPEYEYTGKAIRPQITLEYLGTVLKEGVDYSTPIFTNNTKLGTATVTINGLGKFAGTTRTATFKIVQPGTAETPVKETGEVTTDTLNVRSGPSTNHSIVTTISRGTKVSIHSITNGWYNVTFSKGDVNYNGYVSGDYIKIVDTGYEVEESDTRAQVMVTSAPIKSSATNGSAIVINLSRSDQMYVNGESGSWYKISLMKDGLPYAGYIEKQFVKIISGDAKPIGMVVANTANVLSSASTSSSVKTTLNRNQYAYIDGESDSFYLVSFIKGSSWYYGYMKKDYLRDYDLPRNYTVTKSDRLAQIMVSEIIVRDEANTGSAPVTVVPKNSYLYINEDLNNGWYKVSLTQTANATPYEGYVRKQYVKIYSGDPKPLGVVVANTVNVLSSANTNSSVKTTLNRNQYAYIDGESGNFYTVSFTKGSSWYYGYIKKDYLRDYDLPRDYEVEESERTAQVMVSEVIVRDEANTGSAPVTVIPNGETMYVNEELDGWYKVSLEQTDAKLVYEGYVRKQYVKITSGEPKPLGIIVADTADVLSSESTSASTKTTLNRNQYAYIDGESDSFYLVSFTKGNSWYYGYIQKDYLRNNDLPRDYAVEESDCTAQVMVNEVIIRDAPDSNSAPVTVIQKDETMYVNDDSVNG